MEPLAPDWRALGDGSPSGTQTPAQGHSRGTHRSIQVTPRIMGWVIAGLMAAALAGAAVFLALLPSTDGVLIDDRSSGTSASAAALAAASLEPGGLGPAVASDLVVDVEGAVAHPGLVRIPVGGRVGDALAKAGGFAPNADLTRAALELNLAQPVSDGLKVVVPAIGQGSTATTPAGTGPAAGGGPLDLNRATEAELDALPGVGPATIAKIVAARRSAPFATVADLRTRDILGEATFEKLQDLVAVGR